MGSGSEGGGDRLPDVVSVPLEPAIRQAQWDTARDFTPGSPSCADEITPRWRRAQAAIAWSSRSRANSGRVNG